jgi:hypothetical protein
MDMERVYLEEGDEVVSDFTHFTLNDKNELVDPQLGDCTFWHDGIVANKDEDGRFYILQEVECID